jgi:hypothetical protein
MGLERAWEGVKAPSEMSSPEPPMRFIPRTAIPRSSATGGTTEVWVQWVEKLLDGIDSISAVEHFQMNRRVLVPKRPAE